MNKVPHIKEESENYKVISANGLCFTFDKRNKEQMQYLENAIVIIDGKAYWLMPDKSIHDTFSAFVEKEEEYMNLYLKSLPNRGHTYDKDFKKVFLQA